MELKGNIWAQPSFGGKGALYYTFFADSCDDEYFESQGYVKVCPHTITFAPIDPKALIEGQVVCLLRRKEKLNTEHTQAIRAIDDAIANLRCLEMSPATAE